MRNRVAVTFVAALVTMVVTFLAGYLPQRSQRLAAEARTAELDTRLAAAEAHVRGGELLGRTLAVKEAAMRNDFGRAGELASTLFDGVRAEAGATPDDGLRAGLADVLSRRDVVTTALARAEPGSVAALHQIELRLRESLGFPTPAPPQ